MAVKSIRGKTKHDAVKRESAQRRRELLGKMLREHGANYKQADLAEELHYTQAYVSEIFSGAKSISYELALKITGILKPRPTLVHQFMACCGFAPPDTSPSLHALVEAVMADDMDDTIVEELVRADIARLVGAWHQLVRSSVDLRAGSDIPTHLELLRRIAEDETLSSLVRLYASRRRAETMRVGKSIREARELLSKNLQSTTMGLLRQALPHHARFMEALFITQQGELAFTLNQFESAREYFEQSVQGYSALLEAANHLPETSVEEARDESAFDSLAQTPSLQVATEIEKLGRGRIEVRLAEICMRLEQEPEARERMEEATQALEQVSESPLARESRQRLTQLRAWMAARAGWFEVAIPLHQEAVQEAERNKDRLSRLINLTYVTDDYLRWIEATIQDYCESALQPGENRLLSPGAAWRALLHQQPELAERLACAKQANEQAWILHKPQIHVPSFGHYVRNSAAILRLEAASDAGASARYLQISALLDRAAKHERDHESLERLPYIHEERANAYWDQNHLHVARRWYHQALGGFEMTQNKYIERTGHESKVLTSHIERVWRKLDRLERAISQEHALQAGPQRSETTDSELLEQLELLVVEEIQRSARVEATIHPFSRIWFQHLSDLEERPGIRVLAQNELSLSLYPRLPAYILTMSEADEEEADNLKRLTERRRDFLMNSIRGVSRHAGWGSNRDICCRAEIERLYHKYPDDLRPALSEALKRMRDENSAYALNVISHPLPLGFTVKGAHVLLEIPMEYAQRYPRVWPHAGELPTGPNSRYCYHFEQQAFADNLRALFDQLFASSGIETDENDTEQWLVSLVTSL